MKANVKTRKGDMVPRTFKAWFINDRDHSVKWREEAKTCHDFVAGRQWTEEEEQALKEKARPVVVFNRIGTVIDSIHGHEIGNRRDVRYIPREQGDIQANEILTSAADWFRDQSHADDEESDAFISTLITGMGWTESRIDYEENPEGTPEINRVDEMEMYWDYDAKRRNLTDARRIWRVRKVPLSEAQSLFPDYDADQLDADWISASEDDINKDNAGSSAEHGTADQMVTLVQCQWVERENYYIALDPMSGQEAEFSVEEFEKANKRMKKLIGTEMQGFRRRRKVRKQAFFGKVVLSVGDAPCPKAFSFQCITGKRDRNRGVFYGVVRAMLDPQRWANKWLSQMMHIMNSNSKGGLMAEEGAFEDISDAEESWADPSAITWMKNGALSSGKVKEKTPTQFPAGFQQLTEFAISSIRDVSGVSVEMLGMREANQAASLEAQRRQAGMTILQPLFDSLKHYRELQGRVMLHYIQEDLSDGRLIKIVGEGGEQYVPLVKNAAYEYDIIVDDAPNSPNQREMAWSMMTQLMPMLGKNLTPEIIAKLLEYSPLPSKIVTQLQEMSEKASQQQAQMAQQQQQIQQANVQAELEKTKSEAAENMAEAERLEAQTQLDKAQLSLDLMSSVPPMPFQ